MPHEGYLAKTDARYSHDMQMLGEAFSGPGNYSQVAPGTWVHPTRESLDYALALLQAGGPTTIDRAAAVIRKVISLQDTDPTSPTYGIWPWLLEEPLEAMAPPDWNWADFCGIRLAQIVVDHASLLPDDLQGTLRDSLGHAAWSIFRRNVGPSYTNIAIMGAGVAVVAGEVLNEPPLLDYGRRRFCRIVELSSEIGGFTEYNSPTYTLVALHACERTLHLAHDLPTREHCEQLRCMAWQTIADHFHPGTGQWAGPNSRAYSSYLSTGHARYLSEQTGVSIQPHPAAPSTTGAALVPGLPCPPDLVDRFRSLPEPEVVVMQGCGFAAHLGGDGLHVATTWLDDDACLGSINGDIMWTQRRVLSAYWRTKEDTAVALRLRFLHDGQDFASAVVRNAQDGARVLSVFGLMTGLGDFHPMLDRPEDGRFSAEDFRVRYELTGVNVAAERIDEHAFSLGAGEHKAVIHTARGQFDKHHLVWELGAENHQVWVDGVCYRGERRSFDLSEIRNVIVAAAVELLDADDSPSDGGLAVERQKDGTVEVSWPVGAGLQIVAPTQAEQY